MQHDYEAIVTAALNDPGKMHSAYQAFHEYSAGNRWLAMMQLGRAEPIATYKGWLAVGRQVTKGAKAIELLMPVTKKLEEGDEQSRRVFFIARRFWFGMHDTTGAEYTPSIPDFDLPHALAALGIRQEPFEHPSGNCMGYAKAKAKIIAVSPLAFDPIKTTFHECAHVLLHSDRVNVEDGSVLPKDAREVEAELTAYLVKASLGLTDNLEYSRGYIQHWLADTTVERLRYSRVFGAADAILKAGRVEPAP